MSAIKEIKQCYWEFSVAYSEFEEMHTEYYDSFKSDFEKLHGFKIIENNVKKWVGVEFPSEQHYILWLLKYS